MPTAFPRPLLGPYLRSPPGLVALASWRVNSSVDVIMSLHGMNTRAVLESPACGLLDGRATKAGEFESQKIVCGRSKKFDDCALFWFTKRDHHLFRFVLINASINKSRWLSVVVEILSHGNDNMFTKVFTAVNGRFSSSRRKCKKFLLLNVEFNLLIWAMKAIYSW